MSYNIDAIDYIGDGQLRLSLDAQRHARQIIRQDDRPEDCFLSDDSGTLGRIAWDGDGSGNTFKHLLRALSYTMGHAELVVCWEGGDSYTGLRVRDGVVTEHKVVFALGEES